MRNFERQADAFVYTLLENARPLISTFNKIVTVSGQSADKPNWHHFSIRQRVDFLRQCEADRTHIRRHDHKVRNSIVAYAVVMLLVGVAGYQLNFGQTGKRLNEKFFETVILNEISRGGDSNAGLYGMLGDLYFGRDNLEQAALAYRRALELEPDSALVLNNYAWLLATSQNSAYRDPQLALTLARKAAALEHSSHVMDTLAESLFINGFTQEAIAAAATARSLAKSNLSYYDGQLERFQAARDNPVSD